MHHPYPYIVEDLEAPDPGMARGVWPIMQSSKTAGERPARPWTTTTTPLHEGLGDIPEPKQISEDNPQHGTPMPTNEQDPPTPPQPPANEVLVSDDDSEESSLPERSGRRLLVIALGVLSPILLIVGSVFFLTRDSQPAVMPSTTESAPEGIAQPVEESPPVVEADAEAEEVAEASTPSPAPETPPSPPVAEAAPATSDPTNCTFVNGSWPMVGDKYIVKCDGDELFTATKGEYLMRGRYAFSDFTSYP
ncbi:hypothetical protein HQ487_03700 [Candidatus Uhrbacteria bacterium]|nr:hypothetical protein [Candidatus Uhrbacteria bacterium]